MTLANRITIFRLLLVPVFVICVLRYDADHLWMRHVALGIYFCAAISDIADGFVARHFNQRSRLGAVLDPLSDKLAINIAFIFLAAYGTFETKVPMWFPLITLGRDVLIVIGAYLINELYQPFKARPRVLGKLTTFFQNASIIAVLLEVDFARYVLLATVVVTVLSCADYMYAGSRQVSHEGTA